MQGQPRNTGKRISEAEFRRMWEDLSISATEIGRRLGITQQAVTHRAQKRGLPRRPKRGGKPACDPRDVQRMYLAGVRLQDIAEALSCDRKTVSNYVTRLGLTKRGGGRHNVALSLDDFRALQLRDRMAETARREQAALCLAEMVDGRRTGGDGRRSAA